MINITLIIIVVLSLCLVYLGFEKGMAKQISGFVALTVTLCVMALCIMLFSSFQRGESKNVFFTIILLVILGSIYGVVKLLLKSLRAITHLPGVGFFDRMLGMVIGLGKVLLFVWVFFLLMENGWLSAIEGHVRGDIANSSILTMLYKYNIFIR